MRKTVIVERRDRDATKGGEGETDEKRTNYDSALIMKLRAKQLSFNIVFFDATGFCKYCIS